MGRSGLVCVTCEEIHTDALGLEVLRDDVLRQFQIKLFATEDVKVRSSVQFHEMTTDIAGSDQLHETVPLLGIAGQQVFDHGLSMCDHVNAWNQILDEAIDVFSAGQHGAIATTAIQHKMITPVCGHFISCQQRVF